METLSIVTAPARMKCSDHVKILVSNDDGYLATGIRVLAEALAEIAEIVVVAPDRNHSGASNSLTLHSPLRLHKVSDNSYSVNGTPSDCVHLALSGYLNYEPDIVVSGINHGANLGDDVIYSGTVAAAMEGRFLGLPAIAVSLVGRRAQHFETAATVARDLVLRLQNQPLAADVILNVNVPDLPFDELSGISSTRLGFRHKAEPLIRNKDPHGRTIYWIGPAGPGQDAGPGTDFAAIERGAVAVTPLKVDLTNHDAVKPLADWLQD
jgi:5'-nucleotidase